MGDAGKEAGKDAGSGAVSGEVAKSGLPARRFTDREVGELIRRAIELQEGAATPGSAPPGKGLTMDEVRQIASEVGIDPRFLDLAASGELAELDREEVPLVGGPHAWRLRRALEGEIPEEERGRLLEAIRHEMKVKGDVEDVYGRMEWSNDDGLGAVVIGVSSRDGTTTVDVMARRGGEVGLLHGLAVPMGGMMGGALVAGLLGLDGFAETFPAVLGCAGLSFLGVRTWWQIASARWERKLTRIADRLAEIGRSVAEPGGGEPGPP
jgi:hypothetical protein